MLQLGKLQAVAIIGFHLSVHTSPLLTSNVFKTGLFLVVLLLILIVELGEHVGPFYDTLVGSRCPIGSYEHNLILFLIKLPSAEQFY